VIRASFVKVTTLIYLNMPDEAREISYEPQPNTPETKQLPFKVTEISSTDQLLAVAKERSSEALPERIIKNLTNLSERTKEVNTKLFIVESKNLRFAVVADNKEMISKNQKDVNSFLSFQESIDPDSLWGNCIYIHEFAAALGFTDGNAYAIRAKDGDNEKSIYPIQGIHEIGWKKVENHLLWVDFTSRPYIFSEGDAAKSVIEGLIVIQEDQVSLPNEVAHIPQSIQILYQCGWYKENFNPNHPLSEHVLEKGKKQFVKKTQP
jgi:hypothetical protein